MKLMGPLMKKKKTGADLALDKKETSKRITRTLITMNSALCLAGIFLLVKVLVHINVC